MLNEELQLNGCDETCGEIESLSEQELSFDAFITGSASAPVK